VFRAAKELKLQRDPGTAIQQNSSKNDMGKGYCITSRAKVLEQEKKIVTKPLLEAETMVQVG